MTDFQEEHESSSIFTDEEMSLIRANSTLREIDETVDPVAKAGEQLYRILPPHMRKHPQLFGMIAGWTSGYKLGQYIGSLFCNLLFPEDRE